MFWESFTRRQETGVEDGTIDLRADVEEANLVRSRAWFYSEQRWFHADNAIDAMVEAGDMLQVRFIRTLHSEVLDMFGVPGEPNIVKGEVTACFEVAHSSVRRFDPQVSDDPYVDRRTEEIVASFIHSNTIKRRHHRNQADQRMFNRVTWSPYCAKRETSQSMPIYSLCSDLHRIRGAALLWYIFINLLHACRR